MNNIITYNLSDNFIEKLGSFTEDNFIKTGKDLSKVAFVFGGRRPELFFKKELSQRLKKGFLSPRFFNMDDFVEYIINKKAPCRMMPDLDACYIIYKLAKEISPEILEGRETFSQFLPWAREILGFIEQLDLEDIKPDNLKNIQFKAEIGYDVPENINSLLKSIINIRGIYHSRLKEIPAYSRGLKYLLASEAINETSFDEFEQIIFCGFFYLHKTEKRIIKTLADCQKATLLFQGSASEWSILKKLSQDFQINITPEDKPDEKPLTKLFVQSGFDAHSQACLTRELLKKINGARPAPKSGILEAAVNAHPCSKEQDFGPQKYQPDKTVVVLPNPENLIPLLSEVAGLGQDFNVSMGYPLKRSSLYSLFECIFQAQKSIKDNLYYAKDYLKTLSHPLVKSLKVMPEPGVTRILAHKIEEVIVGIEKTELSGSLFIKLAEVEQSKNLYDSALNTIKTMNLEASLDSLKSAVKKLHHLFFGAWENINNFSEFSSTLGKIMDYLAKKSFLANYPLNLKMTEKILQINEELKNASFSEEPFSKEEIFKIFENKISSELVSFSGSPLKGLQILGLLETRSLNFENVIILDVNESVLPSLKIYEPLIPREIMISLGLNRLEKEEEIQRYQFKRLLAASQNAYLIYQQRNDKEKSRFIEELVWEKQKELNTLDAVMIPKASFKVKTLPKPLEIKKDDKIIRALKQREYSASSINTYLHCPLSFYYQYVLGLEEKETLLDEPQGQDIGTFIHELFHEQFSQFLNKKPLINAKFKKDFKAALDNKFSESFERKMESDSFLIKDMLDMCMERFLEKEVERNVSKIAYLERNFSGKIEFAHGVYKFTSRIDRIDELSDNSFLIIDYKTGREAMPQDAAKIEAAGFNRETLKKTIGSFQLPLYLYLVGNNSDYTNRKINAALYFIKNMELSRIFKKEEQLNQKDEIMKVYLNALESLIGEIINPDMPFKADSDDPRKCRYCPFFYLCR